MASPFGSLYVRDEIFKFPAAYYQYPLIEGQASTVGWTGCFTRIGAADVSAVVADFIAPPDKPRGLSAGAPGQSSSALLIGSAAIDTTWDFNGIQNSLNSQSPEWVLPGARRMGFYVAGEIAGNPTITIDVTADDQWGREFIERVVLVGQTNEKQAAWVSWADNFTNNKAAAPVAGGIYNPNSGAGAPNNFTLGAGGTANGSVNWERLPVVNAFQTRKAIGRAKRIKLIARSGTTADTILVPHFKTLAFGLRSTVNSIDDIIGGYVENETWTTIAAFTSTAAFIGNILVQNTGTHFVCGLSKPNMSVDPEFNVVKFDTTVAAGLVPRGAKNNHVVNNANAIQSIDQTGVLQLGSTDYPWTLVIKPRGPVRAHK